MRRTLGIGLKSQKLPEPSVPGIWEPTQISGSTPLLLWASSKGTGTLRGDASGTVYVGFLDPLPTLPDGDTAWYISQWDDKSGNNRHLTQTVATSQMQARFSGGATGIFADANVRGLSAPSFSVAQPQTVVHVISASESGTQERYVSLNQAAGNEPRTGQLSGTTTMRSGSTTTYISGGSLASEAIWVIEHYSAGTSRIRRNGTTVATGSVGNVSYTRFHVGDALNVGAGALAVDHREVLLISGILSAGDLANLETYLSNKWGIAI